MDFNWLITSSADPKKTSLFVSGLVVAVGGFVIQVSSTACGLGLYCLGIDSEMVNEFAGVMQTLTFGTMIVVGGLMGLYGLVRKVVNRRWAAPRE
jgi:hypothetical protein